jgi:hypothetical protein
VDLQRYRTRLIIAFACAIALHEIGLSLLRPPARPVDEERHIAVTVLAIQTPRPTPHPTPTPRPTPPPTPPPRRTVPPRPTLAPQPQLAGHALGTPQRHRGGGVRRARIIAAVPAPAAAPTARGNGSGTSTGSGTGDQPAAGGGLGGAGAGTSGNGNGAVNAETPCGAVDLMPDDEPQHRGNGVSEHVVATVSFPDHHQESAAFPYRWVYAGGEETDPWSATNLQKSAMTIPLVMPPPGADRSSYPPLIQYILQHTDANGITDLSPCPGNR